MGINIENLILIETRDAILIAKRGASHNLKNIVEELNIKGFEEGKNHAKVFRPWGNYLSIEQDANWKVKKISINPGASLSLQLHRHRSEHWIVVNGTAEVQIGNKKELLSANESTYIPIGFKHRLSNPGNLPLTLIEIQIGDYLGEDDIQRFEDNYGRTFHKKEN